MSDKPGDDKILDHPHGDGIDRALQLEQMEFGFFGPESQTIIPNTCQHSYTGRNSKTSSIYCIYCGYCPANDLQQSSKEVCVHNVRLNYFCTGCQQNKTDYTTKDSGKRTQFNSGMQRDTNEDKIRYDLVYMPMLKRWAELMTRGAKKYSANNWKKASTQEELERFKESAFRHFMEWFLDEDTGEDSAAAIFFNVSGVEYVKERTKNAQ